MKTLLIAVALLIPLFAFIPAAAQSPAPPTNSRLAAGEHYAEFPGVKLFYAVRGKGPVLVIQAPGWGVGSEYLRNGLAPLETDFTVITFDPRGSGRSSRPDPKTMTTGDMADDLDRLRRFWGLDSLTVLGHSQGGAIALGYAIRYPGNVRKLVLVDTNPDDHDDHPERERQIAARKDDPRFKDAIAALGGGGQPKTDDEFGAFLARILPLFFYDPVAAMPRYAKTAPALPTVWAFQSFSPPEKVMMKQDAFMGRVQAKTLVIVGKDDWVCPLTDAQHIHEGIANSQLVVLDRVGHFPWIEAPKEFFDQVVRFAK
jgi:pimeloyl-ACP methyl ester carboxylesterase